MENYIPVQKNKEYIVTIIDYGCEGEGIAKIDNFTIFIPGALKSMRRLPGRHAVYVRSLRKSRNILMWEEGISAALRISHSIKITFG